MIGCQGLRASRLGPLPCDSQCVNEQLGDLQSRLLLLPSLQQPCESRRHWLDGFLTAAANSLVALHVSGSQVVRPWPWHLFVLEGSEIST